MTNTTVALSSIPRLIGLLLVGAITSSFACGQAEPKQSQASAGTNAKPDISTAVAKAQSDSEDSIYYVEQLARAKASQAIPMLEQKFERTQNPLDRAHVASALLRLGDKNDTYWNFLEKQAAQAIENAPPDFMSYDSQGKSVPGPSPEFTAWAKTHGLASSGMGEQIYLAPAPVGILALTADPRGVPLLQKALLSPNHQIEIFAAMGLAEIQDHNSVPLIIEDCRKAPAEVATAIAQSLVYFDEPEAQRAVDTYMPAEVAKIFREARAQGKKPIGY